ncbi:family 1 glycosylhydrolase [Paraflavisolibacter sp. H34]|uniref:glycoside hydrolase family 1 protein n=1 Tax=Huijunlia imazamoxiresistens TaxID=3127457 RepID=UPI003016246A
MIHVNDFGKNFFWGIASSACQTEGGYIEEGKGLSIWDVFSSLPGTTAGGHHPQVSCDFHNHYLHDILLLHYLNCRHFRFSLSWPRIFPNGTGGRNVAGLDFYDRIIDFCLEMEIEPWITLYHWDLPHALEREGGWTNRNILDWFARYVETCARRFGDRVKHWTVLNEPVVFTGAGYFLGTHAPGRKGLTNFLAAAHHAALCQSLGGQVLKSVNRNLKVGTALSSVQFEPADDSKTAGEAALKADALFHRLFLEPLLGLGYPFGELDFLHHLEPFLRPEDEKALRFDMDFFCLQHYSREVVKYSRVMPYLHARIVKAADRKVPLTARHREIRPQSIYHQLKRFAAYPQVKSLLVAQNGATFDDSLHNGQVQDEGRIRYLNAHLEQVLRAKKEGVPVHGFFHQGLTDSFEWTAGYHHRNGLVYVDYPTQKRTIKASGHFVRAFLGEAREKFTGSQVHEFTS